MRVSKNFAVLGFIFQFAIWSFLGWSSLGSSAFAQNKPRVTIDQYSAICDGVTVQPGVPNAKAESCAAVRSDLEGVKVNRALMITYSSIAAICAISCALTAASIVPPGYYPYGPMVCTGGTIAASIADAVATKSYMSTLMNVGMSLATSGAMTSSQKTEKKPVDSKKAQETAKSELKADAKLESKVEGKAEKVKTKTDLSACISALTNAGLAYAKKGGIDSSQASALSDLQAAADFNSSGPSIDGGAPTLKSESGSGGGSIIASGGGTSGLPSTSATDAGGATKTSNDCANSGSAGNVNATLVFSCAKSSNSELPSFLGSPQFGDSFKKMTGMDLGNFANVASQSPTQAISAATSQALGSDGAAQVQTGLARLEDAVSHSGGSGASYYASSDGGATGGYSSGGGGSGSSGGGGDSGDAAMNEMMGNLMSQLMPGSTLDEKNQLLRAAEIEFPSLKNRTVATLEKDTSVSIFDRISFRYFINNPQMLGYIYGRGAGARK